MSNKVEICGVNTAKLPVLTNDKTMELFPSYAARGEGGPRGIDFR